MFSITVSNFYCAFFNYKCHTLIYDKIYLEIILVSALILKDVPYIFRYQLFVVKAIKLFYTTVLKLVSLLKEREEFKKEICKRKSSETNAAELQKYIERQIESERQSEKQLIERERETEREREKEREGEGK